MNTTPVSELTLYRYRYLIGYTLLVVLSIALLVINFHTLPPGMTASEQASALASSRINLHFRLDSFDNFSGDLLNFLRTTDAVNLPYHLLQKASLQFFGLSPLGVRLPSILAAAASIFMLFGLLRRWLRPNTAILTSLLVATSSWFVSIGRLGTPDSMVIFWTSTLLLLATLISQESRSVHLWRGIGLISFGLSLYTPYTIYLFLGALLATITQPHLRYLVRYASKITLTIGGVIAGVLLVPLVFSLWYHPASAWDFLALPAYLPDPISFVKNFITNVSILINPLHVGFTEIPRPLIAVPTVALAGIGGFQLLKEWHSVRAHVLLVWLALLVPLVGLDPTGHLVVLFVPVMLLCAIGLQQVVAYWYRLFPRNPYARVFGLLPIGLLLFTLIQFNYQRYFLGLPYASSTVAAYNQDPFLLTQTVGSKTYREQRLLLITSPESLELYAIDQTVADKLQVVTPTTFVDTNTATRVIISESAFAALTPNQLSLLPPGKNELIVNDRKDNGLRFRVYSGL